MAILASDLQRFQAATHSLTQSGGAITSTPLSSTQNAFLDQVSETENTDGAIEYRCYYIKNNHASLELQNPLIGFTDASSTLGSTEIALAFDIADAVAPVTDHGTLPLLASGGALTFATATAGTPIALGYNLGSQEVAVVWVRRTVPAGSPALNVSIAFTFSGVTAA